MKTEKIKDSILEILRDTQIGNVERGITENSIKMTDFWSKIKKTKETESIFEELITSGYIRRPWINIVLVCALEDKGISKLRDGGFMGEVWKNRKALWFWPLLITVVGLMLEKIFF